MLQRISNIVLMICRLLNAYQRSKISNNRRFDNNLQLSRRFVEYRNDSFVKIHIRNRCFLKNDLNEIKLCCFHSNRLKFRFYVSKITSFSLHV